MEGPVQLPRRTRRTSTKDKSVTTTWLGSAALDTTSGIQIHSGINNLAQAKTQASVHNAVSTHQRAGDGRAITSMGWKSSRLDCARKASKTRAVHLSLNVFLNLLDWPVQSEVTTLTAWYARPTTLSETTSENCSARSGRRKMTKAGTLLAQRQKESE